MGAGKTSIGKKLASIFNLEFFDLDNFIEQQTRASIPFIFNLIGEKGFREIENLILKKFLEEKNNFVLATGGGTPVYFNNLDLLKDNGLTIYIEHSPSTIFHRLTNSKKRRPLIMDKNPMELKDFIEKSIKEREHFYKKAHLVVDGLNLNAKNLAVEIKKYFSRNNNESEK